VNPTLLFVWAGLALVSVHAALLALIINRLVRKIAGGKEGDPSKLEMGTMDVLPLIFSLVFIISVLSGFLIIASMLHLWSAIALIAALSLLTFLSGKKLVGILKKIK